MSNSKPSDAPGRAIDEAVLTGDARSAFVGTAGDPSRTASLTRIRPWLPV